MVFPGQDGAFDGTTDSGIVAATDGGIVDQVGGQVGGGVAASSIECPAPGRLVDGRCAMQLSIRVGIDGVSDLILRRSEIHWRHIRYVVPNAAVINGVVWQPDWPGQSTTCRCDSSPTVLSPPLPARAQPVVVTPQSARTPILVDQPTAANDHTLVLHFDDSPGGSAYYEFTIEYVSP